MQTGAFERRGSSSERTLSAPVVCAHNLLHLLLYFIYCLHTQVLLKEGHAVNAHNAPVVCSSPSQQQAIRAAQSASDMYQVCFCASSGVANCCVPLNRHAHKQTHTCKHTYAHVKMCMQVIQQDSWVVVPITSISRTGHMMEGTRLTLVKVSALL